jgi:hypothetical protein
MNGRRAPALRGRRTDVSAGAAKAGLKLAEGRCYNARAAQNRKGRVKPSVKKLAPPQPRWWNW